MSAAFTPGPWDWWDDGTNLVRITEASEQRLVGRAVKPSDARLICAAPELYDTIRRVADQIVSIEGRTKGDRLRLKDQLAVLRAALAKARGETA